jgi:hypothetical protein
MPNQEEVKQDSANIYIAGDAQSAGANAAFPRMVLSSSGRRY